MIDAAALYPLPIKIKTSPYGLPPREDNRTKWLPSKCIFLFPGTNAETVTTTGCKIMDSVTYAAIGAGSTMLVLLPTCGLLQVIVCWRLKRTSSSPKAGTAHAPSLSGGRLHAPNAPTAKRRNVSFVEEVTAEVTDAPPIAAAKNPAHAQHRSHSSGAISTKKPNCAIKTSHFGSVGSRPKSAMRQTLCSTSEGTCKIAKLPAIPVRPVLAEEDTDSSEGFPTYLTLLFGSDEPQNANLEELYESIDVVQSDANVDDGQEGKNIPPNTDDEGSDTNVDAYTTPDSTDSDKGSKEFSFLEPRDSNTDTDEDISDGDTHSPNVNTGFNICVAAEDSNTDDEECTYVSPEDIHGPNDKSGLHA